jgi:hypothetical protein
MHLIRERELYSRQTKEQNRREEKRKKRGTDMSREMHGKAMRNQPS